MALSRVIDEEVMSIFKGVMKNTEKKDLNDSEQREFNCTLLRSAPPELKFTASIAVVSRIL